MQEVNRTRHRVIYLILAVCLIVFDQITKKIVLARLVGQPYVLIEGVFEFRYLENRGVQTRMLFSGNLLRHPCFDEIRGTDAYRTVGELKNTEIILENTFWIGTYPGMTEEKCARMVKLIHEAVKASEEAER